MTLEQKLKAYAERRADEHVPWPPFAPVHIAAQSRRLDFQAGFAAAVELLGGAVAALDRVRGMCDTGRAHCLCGRPNGLPAVVSCSGGALTEIEEKLEGA